MQGEAEAPVRAWVEYCPRPRRPRLLSSRRTAAADLERAGHRFRKEHCRGGERRAVRRTRHPPHNRYSETSSVPPLNLISFSDLAPLPMAAIPPADREASLRAIQEEIGDCTRCPLAYADGARLSSATGRPRRG